MRKFAASFVFVLVFGAFALAQMEPQPLVVPNTELFLGYAYQHADTSGSNLVQIGGVPTNLVNVDSTNLNGFAFEFSHYLPQQIRLYHRYLQRFQQQGRFHRNQVRPHKLLGRSQLSPAPMGISYIVGPRARRC